MAKLPLDNESRRTDAKACAIVHYSFDTEHWQYREITGADVGCDCELELSEANKWLGNKIECQIKGTKHIGRYLLTKGKAISFPLDIKTINYGLNKANSFVLLVVDVVEEFIYYECIQEHFISNTELFKKLENEEAKTVNIRIPISNVLDTNDASLQNMARMRFRRNEAGWLQLIT